MGNELAVAGAIVDSWMEPPGRVEPGSRVVLQVAPRGRPRDLVIVEAASSLFPDQYWLEDLGENLCHGMSISAVGRLMLDGLVDATRIELAR